MNPTHPISVDDMYIKSPYKPPPSLGSSPQAYSRPIKASPVDILGRRFASRGAPGSLIWYENGTIALKALDIEEPLFSCRAEDLVKFRYWSMWTFIELRNSQQFIINMNLDSHRLWLRQSAAGAIGSIDRSINPPTNNFGGSFRPVAAFAGIARSYYALKMVQSDHDNDSAWWVANLKKSGVQASRITTLAVDVLIFVSVILLGPIVIFIAERLTR
jgi:hypothetical protein